MGRDDETPRGNRMHGNNTVRNISIASGVAVLAVIVPAAVTWATDRSELKAATTSNDRQEAVLREHQTKLDDLSRGAAVRDANDANLREQLSDIKRQLDRIAERVGAKQ